MGGALQIDGDPFDGGPPLRWQKAVGLVRPGNPRIIRRIQLVILIGWLPLVLLAAFQFLFSRNGTAKSLLFDFAVYARYLIAAPLLILAEADCIPRLAIVARHFLDAGFIRETERGRYEQAIASTRRLLDSTLADIITVALVYLLIVALIVNVRPEIFPAWHRSGGEGAAAFSLAGWWHVLVSLPLLLILFFGWFWRLLLWGRFLFLMSRLNLRLVPSHPDQVGGLKFVSSSLRGFRLIALSLGTIAAGTEANRVMYEGTSPLAFRNVTIGLLAFVLILSAGPLTIFTAKLRATKRRGIFEYGALARAMGQQFEQKWVGRTKPVDESALSEPDFSAMTDLYQTAGNVYEMKNIPFGLMSLLEIVCATLLPFVLVALMAVPLDLFLERIVKLLL
jgi:hypothetical protein